jgi:hypothetical protein
MTNPLEVDCEVTSYFKERKHFRGTQHACKARSGRDIVIFLLTCLVSLLIEIKLSMGFAKVSSVANYRWLKLFYNGVKTYPMYSGNNHYPNQGDKNENLTYSIKAKFKVSVNSTTSFHVVGGRGFVVFDLVKTKSIVYRKNQSILVS